MILGKRADRTWSASSTIPWSAFSRGADSRAPDMAFRAPGFERVAERIAARQRSGVLDLGPPSRANVEYLSQYSCVLHIGDLSRALADDPEMSVPEEEFDPEAIAGRLIAYDDDIRFDAVLAWDIFDYIDTATSKAIMGRVGNYCSTGTLLYLITSNGETIPDQPGRFTILDEQHLRFERTGAGTRDGMRHSPRGLERIMPGFRLRHSYLLAHQMQDYLFIHV